MLYSKTLSGQVSLLAGNRLVAEKMLEAIKFNGLLKAKFCFGEPYEMEYQGITIVVTENTMYAMNSTGTQFEDLTNKRCLLKIFKNKGNKDA